MTIASLFGSQVLAIDHDDNVSTISSMKDGVCVEYSSERPTGPDARCHPNWG